MSEDTQPGQQATGDLDTKSDRAELLEKLRRLEEQRVEVDKMKKSMAKDYSDQLKGIAEEISDTLVLLKDQMVVPDAG